MRKLAARYSASGLQAPAQLSQAMRPGTMVAQPGCVAVVTESTPRRTQSKPFRS
jgi:hypothetical protein